MALQKRGGLRSTSHLGNNAADNGQRASSVSLKHALNSREPTNWLKPREPDRNPSQTTLSSDRSVDQGWYQVRWSTNDGPCLIEMSKSPFHLFLVALSVLPSPLFAHPPPVVAVAVVVPLGREKEPRENSGEIETGERRGQLVRVKLELSCEGERGESKEKQLV